MAVTAAQFMRSRPEFESAGPQLVTAALQFAAGALDPGSWGTSHDQAVSAKAAHWLWSSPFGVSMRLDGSGKEVSSPYEFELETIHLSRIPRIMVL